MGWGGRGRRKKKTASSPAPQSLPVIQPIQPIEPIAPVIQQITAPASNPQLEVKLQEKDLHIKELQEALALARQQLEDHWKSSVKVLLNVLQKKKNNFFFYYL
eukprot:TRINITY_DN8341_c0_g1_i1.p1 TRINITY_DN8341_c0_g1~~TRINITY_DN8341_c0_g1_i1.p1  ORF type:complete len:103 (+),score=29.22 TRINITY_DN8341_c0_g1_i1:21-329(+)